MKGDDLQLLGQIIASLETSVEKIEDAYKKKNSERFNSAKKFTLQLNRQISEMLE